MSEMMPGRNGGRLKRGGSTGRPKGSVNISSVIRKQLAKRGPDGILNVERVAAALIEQAAGGNVAAIRELMNRIDGPLPTKFRLDEVTDEQLAFLVEHFGVGERRQEDNVIRVVFGDDLDQAAKESVR
jgi:hypothetical protein